MKRPRKRASSVAVIDIGSNSVRLVVYETMARSLVTIFNEKALCGLGREVQSTGLLAADAVAKALTSLRRFRALCRIQKVGRVYRDRHRRLPRRHQRPRLHRQGRTHLRRPHRNPVGPARSETVRARRRLRRPQSRRHRRRSRRRLAGTDRRAWQPRPQRRDAAARQPGAAGPVAQIAEARRAHRQHRSFRRRPAQGRPRPHLLRGRRHLARAGAHPHHPERLSAAGDARLFDSGRRTRSISRGGCAGWQRPTCWPTSKSSPTRGGRC